MGYYTACMLMTTLKGTEIKIGDTVRVSTTVVEGAKTRVQTFEGLLIAFSGRGENKTMTIRRIGARGIGVERIWPLESKSLVGVEVVKHAKNVRRSKLFYLRDRIGKAATQI